MMDDMLITLLICGPAAVALAAAGGAVWMFSALERTEKSASKVLLWIGVSGCSLVAFGIGSCYAMVFTGGFR